MVSLREILGEADTAAARTDTVLGERSRRLVNRRGRLKAPVAIARPIPVIVWQFDAIYYSSHIDKNHKTRFKWVIFRSRS